MGGALPLPYPKKKRRERINPFPIIIWACCKIPQHAHYKFSRNDTQVIPYGLLLRPQGNGGLAGCVVEVR